MRLGVAHRLVILACRIADVERPPNLESHTLELVAKRDPRDRLEPGRTLEGTHRIAGKVIERSIHDLRLRRARHENRGKQHNRYRNSLHCLSPFSKNKKPPHAASCVLEHYVQFFTSVSFNSMSFSPASTQPGKVFQFAAPAQHATSHPPNAQHHHPKSRYNVLSQQDQQ